MTVVVLTVDQRGSRRGPDLVPATLAALADRRLLRPFERTAGDEFQGVLDDPAALPPWSSGCCARTPGTSASASARSTSRSPPRPRRARPAYLARPRGGHRGQEQPVAPPRRAARHPAPAHLETTLWLWAAVLGRRTPEGWEVADLVEQGLSYDEAGRKLGITQSAVSQRAQAAGIVEGRRARELVTGLTDCCSRHGSRMSAEPPTGTLVLVLLGARRVAAPGCWTRAGAPVWAPVTLVALAAAALVAAVPDEVAVDGRGCHRCWSCSPALLAVVGGGP